MKTPISLRSKHLLYIMAMVLFGLSAGASAAEPPTKAFPRIEAGQHTASILRIGFDAQFCVQQGVILK